MKWLKPIRIKNFTRKTNFCYSDQEAFVRFIRYSALALVLSAALTAHAADKVKVGMVTTLSGAGAGLGVDIRDGFNLALKHLDNKFGGLPVEVISGDDQQNPDAAKQLAVSRALAALDEHLAEPLESCLARDADGRPCIEAKIPQDIERDLAMPGGHIFHGDLDWPWAPNRTRLETPAQRWGVQTGVDSVLMCGSGSRRGGAVSGLGGHSAAQAVLAER